MNKTDFWTRKIKAFLSTPPDTSLFPPNQERSEELISVALESETGVIDFGSLKDIRAIAKGFDIPPFLENRNLARDVFRRNPVFKHPLSGEKIKLDLEINAINATLSNKFINDAIIEIREETKKQDLSQYPEDEFYKRLFLALWRKLPDVIRQREKSEVEADGAKIGKYWDWLPADPRVPTHSVWEHSSIVSAIAGTGDEPALLIFTIASPQQFISAARRTQDSWMGSFLYSFLMWEAIRHIADQFGPDCFLFPDLRRQPLVDKWLEKDKGIFSEAHSDSAFQIANFPNMLTAVLPAREAAEVAREAHNAMKAKWKGIADIIKEKVDFAVREKLKISLDDYWEKTWERQINDFLSQNVFWVVCPWQDAEKDAIAVYRLLFPNEGKTKGRIDEFEQLLKTVQKDEINSGMLYQAVSAIASRALTARKNLRDFHNHNQEAGEKCSLCGIRAALHPFINSNRAMLRTFWKRLGEIKNFKLKGERIKFAGRIKRRDALCAVCLVKRLALDFYFNLKRENGFAFDRHLFPSTSTISTAPFKARILKWCREQPENLKTLHNYNQNVREFLKVVKLNYRSSAVPKLERELEGFSGAGKSIFRAFLRLDGQWLFIDSFESVENELAEKLSKYPRAEDLREKAVASLERLLSEFKEDANTAKPSGYYAVVSLDGDQIGNWLNGFSAPTIESLLHPQTVEELKNDSNLKTLIEKKRLLGIISHLSLSIALKNFALEIAPQIIEQENYGKLIFAGGDDLLAFVPVENLLAVVNQLQRFFQGAEIALENNLKARSGVARLTKFSEEREILLAGTSEVEKNASLTASIGVAIIHHSHPLPQAIEEAFARAMKDDAKERLGRNAVAFHLNKRAGTPLAVGFKFDSSPGSGNALSILQKLLKAIKEGSLSSRIAYRMAKRSLGLNGRWTDLSNDPTDEFLWWHEAQKQALRHLVSRHAKKEKASEIGQNMVALLEFLYRSYRKPVDEAESAEAKIQAIADLAGKESDTGWDTLTGLLLLLRYLAGESTTEN